MAASNLGKWDRWYELIPAGSAPQPYGPSPTYRLGADWLADCSLVEDWGCGKGWLRTLVPPDRYRGLDGSCSPFADRIVDLAEYRSSVPGIFMRHVLEHDYRWRTILANACGSFTQRMALIVFTPFAAEGEGTHDVEFEEDPGVPNLSFDLKELLAVLSAGGVTGTGQQYATDTKFETETVFLLERA